MFSHVCCLINSLKSVSFSLQWYKTEKQKILMLKKLELLNELLAFLLEKWLKQFRCSLIFCWSTNRLIVSAPDPFFSSMTYSFYNNLQLKILISQWVIAFSLPDELSRWMKQQYKEHRASYAICNTKTLINDLLLIHKAFKSFMNINRAIR